MTNRLELNWKLDGFVDEQRYYCSETPIDPEYLPVPKAVLVGDVLTYVDTDISVGKTYYVRVGSVKNGVEKISNEIKVIAEFFDFSKVMLQIFADSESFPSSNIVDVSSNHASITNKSISVISSDQNIVPVFDNGLLAHKSVNSYFTAPISQLNYDDFTLELFFCITSSTTRYPRILSIGNAFNVSTQGQITIFADPSCNLLVALGRASSEEYIMAGIPDFFGTTLKHLCIMRKNGKFYAFANGQLKGSLDDPNYSVTSNIFMFGNTDYDNQFSNFYANSIRLTRSAIYDISGFIPPSEKFRIN